MAGVREQMHCNYETTASRLVLRGIFLVWACAFVIGGQRTHPCLNNMAVLTRPCHSYMVSTDIVSLHCSVWSTISCFNRGSSPLVKCMPLLLYKLHTIIILWSCIRVAMLYIRNPNLCIVYVNNIMVMTHKPLLWTGTYHVHYNVQNIP